MSDVTLKKQVFASTETTEVSVARQPLLPCGYHAKSQRHSKISQKRELQNFFYDSQAPARQKLLRIIQDPVDIPVTC